MNYSKLINTGDGQALNPDKLSTRQKAILTSRNEIQVITNGIKEKSIIISEDNKNINKPIHRINILELYGIPYEKYTVPPRFNEKEDSGIKKDDLTMIAKIGLNLEGIISNFSKDFISNDTKDIIEIIKKHNTSLEKISESQRYNNKNQIKIVNLIKQLTIFIKYIERLLEDTINLYDEKKEVILESEKIREYIKGI